MATEVVALLKTALAPIQARLTVLEQKPTAPVVPEVAPEDIAASVAGLLRKELHDLDLPPMKTKRRVEKDATGYTITEEPA